VVQVKTRNTLRIFPRAKLKESFVPFSLDIRHFKSSQTLRSRMAGATCHTFIQCFCMIHWRLNTKIETREDYGNSFAGLQQSTSLALIQLKGHPIESWYLRGSSRIDRHWIFQPFPSFAPPRWLSVLSYVSKDWSYFLFESNDIWIGGCRVFTD